MEPAKIERVCVVEAESPEDLEVQVNRFILQVRSDGDTVDSIQYQAHSGGFSAMIVCGTGSWE